MTKEKSATRTMSKHIGFALREDISWIDEEMPGRGGTEREERKYNGHENQTKVRGVRLGLSPVIREVSMHIDLRNYVSYQESFGV